MTSFLRTAPPPAGLGRATVVRLGLVILGTVAVAILYLVKTALGIDILPGPSPLHPILYPLLMRG